MICDRSAHLFYDDIMLQHDPQVELPFLPSRVEKRVRTVLQGLDFKWSYPKHPGRLSRIREHLDAHRNDMALNLSYDGFRVITRIVQDIADRHCDGPPGVGSRRRLQPHLALTRRPCGALEVRHTRATGERCQGGGRGSRVSPLRF